MALAVARDAEDSAVFFYRHLAETAVDAELKAFYQEFGEIESHHSGWLEPKISEARRTAGGTNTPEVQHPNGKHF